MDLAIRAIISIGGIMYCAGAVCILLDCASGGEADTSAEITMAGSGIFLVGLAVAAFSGVSLS